MTAPYRHHPLDDLAAYALDAVDDLGERQAIEHTCRGASRAAGCWRTTRPRWPGS